MVMASDSALIDCENNNPDYALAEYPAHVELCDAIRSRDPERAQRSMEAQVTQTLDPLDQLSNA